MEKRHICIMKFDTATKVFHTFGSKIFDLDIIPRIGEKVVFEEKEGGIIAEVIDIHYSSDGDVDIYIGKEQPYLDYKSNLDNSYMATLEKRTAK